MDPAIRTLNGRYQYFRASDFPGYREILECISEKQTCGTMRFKSIGDIRDMIGEHGNIFLNATNHIADRFMFELT